jgi:hypothetical protein
MLGIVGDVWVRMDRLCNAISTGDVRCELLLLVESDLLRAVECF